MADPKLSEKWTAGHPLVRIVRKRASDFDVMQLLHLIERIEPGAAPIGHQGPVEHEPLRLRPRLSLGFPPGDIAEVDWYDNPLTLHGQLRITVTYLGLYGSDSPLPTHFTEQLLAEQDDDVRVRDFVDIFHHRIHSLLYRVWKKYRYYVTFRSDGTDPISQVIRGLLGLGTAHLDTQLSVNPVRLFRYAGILAQRPRSAAGLRGQLQDYFEEVPCDIEQCVGRWLTIQPNDRNVMGLGKCTLGEDFLLGERIFDRSGKFRVKLGPVGFDDYTRFLPGGQAAAELAEVTRFYCEDPFDFDIELTLRGDEVPETPLGEHEFLGRLSWTSWLKSEPCQDKSVIFEVPEST
jgi:type VI secretion system protein ImpH